MIKVRFYIILLLIISVATGCIYGQNLEEDKESFLYGEYYLGQSQYREALSFYLQIYDNYQDNSNLNYRIGQCYTHILGEQHKALPYLRIAVKEIDFNYVEGKFKNPGAPREAWLLLGDAFQRENFLLEASYAYHQYRSYLSPADKDLLELVSKKIHSVGISYELQRDPVNLKLTNLGEGINTRFSDYNPVLSGDQKTLIYTSFWESYDRIMISNCIDGQWTTPREITEQVGSAGDCYTTSLSYDGKELYLIRMGRYNSDIYCSKLEEGEWKKMKPLNKKINSNSQETSASLSADGRTLYFCSDRSGGIGDLDIYVATKQGNDWNNIRNLGEPINTIAREDGPYISIDGITLFYSTNGYEGIGGLDIFYSNLNPDNTWDQPENMGPPYNTTEDDLFFIYYKKTKTGYFARTLEEGYGRNDIYSFQEYEYINHTETVKNNHVTNMELSTEVNQSYIANNITTNPDVGEMQQEEIIIDNKADNLQNYEINSVNDLQLTYNGQNENIVDSDEVTESDEIQQRDNHIAFNNYPDQEIKGDYSLDDFSDYTIQIMALLKPVDVSYFSNVEMVKMIKGEDGFHRYITGEFNKLASARKKLKEIRKLGYHDAFIRKLKSIPNIQ